MLYRCWFLSGDGQKVNGKSECEETVYGWVGSTDHLDDGVRFSIRWHLSFYNLDKKCAMFKHHHGRNITDLGLANVIVDSVHFW